MIYYKHDDLVIRSMCEDDIEEFAHGFREQNWNKPSEQFLNYYREQQVNLRKVIVAEYNGNLAGYITLIPCAKKGPFLNKNIPELVDFNVLIKYQRRGIGNKIMDIAESIAKEKSGHVYLAVGLHSGYGTAQRMYIKRGYIPDGTGVWYKGKQLEQYALCANDDELVLYFVKSL